VSEYLVIKPPTLANAAMELFLQRKHRVEQYMQRGSMHTALDETIQACVHFEGEETPPLRDARADLLTEILCRVTARDRQIGQKMDTIQALLERRVFNHRFGQSCERAMFACKSMFDPGFDKKRPIRIHSFILGLHDVDDKYLTWIMGAAAIVDREVCQRRRAWQRALYPRIGLRVFVLPKSTRTNGGQGERGVVFKKTRGDVWEVHFDNGKVASTRVGKLREIAWEARTLTPVRQELKNMAEEMRHRKGRPDVEARVRRIDQELASGTVPTPKCGDLVVPPEHWTEHLESIDRLATSCVGDGSVDFVKMYFDELETTPAEDLPHDRRARFKDWFLSGLCLTCQQRMFS